MQNLKNKINQNINLDILKRLNFIYRSIISEDKTLEYSKKINKLINNYKDIGPKNSKNDYWSENTILLITYADSISRGLSGKTLNDFGKFYKKYLEKFINSIHFLPFFPQVEMEVFLLKTIMMLIKLMEPGKIFNHFQKKQI